jgi:hypothetical protein
MFQYTIDNKATITKNGVSQKDLTDSIFEERTAFNQTYNVYKIPASMEMRVDKLSLGVYGVDDYAELILKYNGISNPFSIEADDIVWMPTLDSITKYVKTTAMSPANITSQAAKIQAYHKYVDKSKLPNTVGSQIYDTVIADTSVVDTSVDASINIFVNESSDTLDNLKSIIDSIVTTAATCNTPSEPNMNQECASSVIIKNGRVYFGTDCTGGCVSDGVSLADYISSISKK